MAALWASAYPKVKNPSGLLKKLNKLRKLDSSLAAGGLDRVYITQHAGGMLEQVLGCPHPLILKEECQPIYPTSPS